MIEKLKLVHSNQIEKHTVSLHSHASDILFEHRRQVSSIFLQIKGHYEIAYFGLNIINPANELVAFSSLPHIEYNLIQQDIWRDDPYFSSKNFNKNTLYCWDEINNEQIRKIKLDSNNFKAGMTISREIDGFNFLYSYATKSNQKELKEYYNSQIFGLIDIGDYFCNAVLKLYSEYCGTYTLPKLNQLKSKAPASSIRSALKLIVNNG